MSGIGDETTIYTYQNCRHLHTTIQIQLTSMYLFQVANVFGFILIRTCNTGS